MSDFAESLRQQFLSAAEKAGMWVVGRERCRQLMAFLYVHGGANSDVVFNAKLRQHILFAQRMLRLEGMETPDPEDVAAINGYVDELCPHGWRGGRARPQWLDEIADEYGTRVCGLDGGRAGR